ncbi:MAG: hypothetical protein BWY48_00555 [Parcubacteria group bacterium ADurb.Bin305]|nr:MAG: hypothetical protein BWY48_00555 [Parcubacteria group bacterium ADurb.Bin305]
MIKNICRSSLAMLIFINELGETNLFISIKALAGTKRVNLSLPEGILIGLLSLISFNDKRKPSVATKIKLSLVKQTKIPVRTGRVSSVAAEKVIWLMGSAKSEKSISKPSLELADERTGKSIGEKVVKSDSALFDFRFKRLLLRVKSILPGSR